MHYFTKALRIYFLSFIFPLLFCSISSLAARSLNNDDKITIEQLKRYLQQIKSVAIDFTQTDEKGETVEGKLLINKPFKFRCNYYPPFPIVIVGNKNYVTLYDYEMEQVSRIKAKENIFNFLLADELELKEHFIIDEVIEDDITLIISLYHSLSERHTQVTCNKITKQIQTIKILEDGNFITLNLRNFKPVSRFDDDLFILRDPSLFGAPPRFAKTELEKKYQIIPEE